MHLYARRMMPMCGICGFMDDDEVPLSDNLEMLTRIRHRGPDQVGVYLDGDTRVGERIADLRFRSVKGYLSLAQARLEITGGREGVQPISGESLTLVHNGEIYNHPELRKLLQHKEMRSESDSEILLHLIEEYYEGDLVHAVQTAMPLLDGMYALAVTDGSTMVLARDPIGKKPLYYTSGFPFYFASERKALVKSKGEIKRLLPGKLAEVKKNSIKIHDGYEIERPPIEINDMAEALDAYEGAFDRSMDKRVYGLNSVGVLFSGGIDSVLVARALQLKGLNVTCYTVGTEGSPDTETAIRAAQELGFNIKVEYLTEDLIRENLADIIEAIELNGLLQVEVAVPMYIAAQKCREDCHKVMFSGQAADELFAGYTWYRDVVRDHGHLILHSRLWEDLDRLYEDTLEREDRLSMAHSIELRVPFLDRELIRTAMRIAPQLKINNADDIYGKRVHRELSLRKGIPREFAYRKKSPAQEGSGIHGLIEVMAAKHFRGKVVKDTELLDFGSNFRYLGNNYGTPEMAALLSEITEKNDLQFIAGSGEN